MQKDQIGKIEGEAMPKRHSLVNVWTVLALLLFYVAYTTYTRGDTQTTAILALVGALLVYMGLSGGTRYEL